jgi:hypothetical protein
MVDPWYIIVSPVLYCECRALHYPAPVVVVVYSFTPVESETGGAALVSLDVFSPRKLRFFPVEVKNADCVHSIEGYMAMVPELVAYRLP